MLKHVLAGVVAATLAVPAFAQEELAETTGDQSLGTSKSSASQLAAPSVSVGNVYPANTYFRAQHASGGVALRNRDSGGIEISNVVTPVKAAFVYWAVITSGSPPTAARSVKIQRVGPTSSAVATVSGTAVGTGSSPCWAGDRITVYKGTVPTSVANGAGTYVIKLNPGASGSNKGGNPWISSPLPMMEGASLVIVGTSSTGTVSLYDRSLSGATWSSYLGYTLQLPTSTTGRNVVVDLIGADGQIGNAREANSSTALEYTYLNWNQIAGPGSDFRDSDWNGGVGQPLPQLWDNIGHQVTAQAPAGTWSLQFDMYSYADCMTPVANVVTQY